MTADDRLAVRMGSSGPLQVLTDRLPEQRLRVGTVGVGDHRWSIAHPRVRVQDVGVRVLLIDAMGTLLALEDPVEPLRAELAERFGLLVSPAEARAALRAEIAYYRRHMGLGRDEASLATLRRACAGALRQALPGTAGLDLTATLLAALRFRAYADAAPGLAAARAAGIERVVVVSNWDAALPEVLERVGLADAVDGVVTSAEAGVAKPAPAIFAAALARVGARAAEAVHIGDSVDEDVAGARAAGVRPVLLDRTGVATGIGCPVIAGLNALPALLHRLSQDGPGRPVSSGN